MGPGTVPAAPFLREGVGMLVGSADRALGVGVLGEWDGPFLAGGRQIWK